MTLKQLIGAILTDLGYVSRDQLEVALRIQRDLNQKELQPERLQRVKLFSEVRDNRTFSAVPLLGKILLKMDFVTETRLNTALKLQKQILQKYKAMEADMPCPLMDICTLVNSSLNLAEVLNIIMTNANKVTKSVASSLMLLDEKTDELVFCVPTGPKSENLADLRIKKGQGIAGWVAENELPAIVPDVTKDPRFYKGIDNITGFTTESILAVPLHAKNLLIGVLEVINKEDKTVFTEKDAMLLSVFAAHAAIAIENARLYGELKKQLDEQKKMEKYFTDVEKFRTLGQLSAGVTHDFNNLLGTIMGYAEIALFSLENKERLKNSIEQVLKASNRAKSLVNQILAFILQSGQIKIPVQVEQVLSEVLKFLRATMPNSIKIHQEIRPNIGTILADPTQIHQILMNLLTNAQHAIGNKEGEIRLVLSNFVLSENNVASYPELRLGSYVKLSVSDDGCGMDAETLNKIFEPYFTTKGKRGGTGMGLAVVQRIVHNLGGAIRVFSEPSQGSTFELFLPKVDVNIETEIQKSDALPTGSERILFVDDEEALVDLGKQMLNHLGYKVTIKTKPKEALMSFSRKPHAYDLVITDLAMPNITGFELAREIKKIRSDIPIILVSGFGDNFTKKKATAVGMSEFVTKPLELKKLAEVVRKALDDK